MVVMSRLQGNKSLTSSGLRLEVIRMRSIRSFDGNRGTDGVQ
jgi:transketolase C-terminal domain/subunit